MLTPSVLCLCLLGLSLVLPESDACTFPQYLTQRPRWESHISLNRRKTEVYWLFHERTAEMMDLTSMDMNTKLHECILELPGQKYILQTTQEEQETLYMCVQFVLRSNQVVQIMKSEVSTKLNAEDLCADRGLELDPWPLVWPKVGETYHTCPLNGGYDFYMVDHQREEVLCENSELKPRIESECMTGEGFSLDFRNFECRGKLDIELKQTLVCLGTWNDKGFTYTIMTDDDDLWPRLWLLRFEVKHGLQFKALLLNDLVADTTLTKNYFELNLHQAIYPSLCENEAFPCNDCEGHNDYYCQKTCHRCDSLQDFKSCEFDLQSRGEWVEISHHGNRDIMVTTSMLYADDMLPLQCFDIHPEAWFDDKNYRGLATVFKNGCKPRYTCVEFQRLSSSVLLYKLSQNLVWPHTLVLTAKDICADSQFVDDPSPLEGEFRSQHLKALVKKNTMNRIHPTVSCEIQGKFLMDAVYDQGARNCTAYLDSCDSSHSFTVKMEAGCHGSQLTEIHRCLASYRQGTTRMVITDKLTPDGTSYCWAFHKNEWDSNYRLYFLYASDCHEDIGLRIKYYGYQGHLAEFRLTAGTGYLGSHSCHHQFTAQPGSTSTPSERTPMEGLEKQTRTLNLNTGSPSQSAAAGVSGSTSIPRRSASPDGTLSSAIHHKSTPAHNTQPHSTVDVQHAETKYHPSTSLTTPQSPEPKTEEKSQSSSPPAEHPTPETTKAASTDHSDVVNTKPQPSTPDSTKPHVSEPQPSTPDSTKPPTPSRMPPSTEHPIPTETKPAETQPTKSNKTPKDAASIVGPDKNQQSLDTNVAARPVARTATSGADISTVIYCHIILAVTAFILHAWL